MQIHELTQKLTEADTGGKGGATVGALGATGFEAGGVADKAARAMQAKKQVGLKNLVTSQSKGGFFKRLMSTPMFSTQALTQSDWMKSYRGGVGSPAAPAVTGTAAAGATAQPEPITLPGGEKVLPTDPLYAQLMQKMGQTALPPPAETVQMSAALLQQQLGLEGMNDAKMAKVGTILRQTASDAVRSTGDATVDTFLRSMGFTVR